MSRTASGPEDRMSFGAGARLGGFPGGLPSGAPRTPQRDSQ
jgi:hypothetical protein